MNPGAKVMVNQFELCPLGDGPCHDLRDGREPINVLALRTQIEQQAHELGLFDTMTRAIGRCAGGDRIAGNFADSCTVYQESTDTELSASLNAELNFELNVDGNAGGHGSWSASYGSLASAELEAAFKASFKLDVDLKARFSTSRVWRERHSLDVIYDPSNTQLQWWRVVTQRLRYVQFGEFDVCGGRVTSHDVFLSDLRESRLVLACESVPSYDTVCHAVEPEATSVAACNDLLIPADSPRGRECLGQ